MSVLLFFFFFFLTLQFEFYFVNISLTFKKVKLTVYLRILQNYLIIFQLKSVKIITHMISVLLFFFGREQETQFFFLGLTQNKDVLLLCFMAFQGNSLI